MHVTPVPWLRKTLLHVDDYVVLTCDVALVLMRSFAAVYLEHYFSRLSALFIMLRYYRKMLSVVVIIGSFTLSLFIRIYYKPQ